MKIRIRFWNSACFNGLTVGLLWLLPAIPLRAQISAVQFENFTTTDGWIGGGVFDMIRDSMGFLWAYTTLGISRFDGFSSKNYLLPLKQWDNKLFSIDNRGVLWATDGSDLFRYDARTDQFVPVALPDSGGKDSWLSFFPSSVPDGTWLRKGTTLYCIRPSENKPELVRSGLKRQWRNFGFRASDGRFFFSVNSIKPDHPLRAHYFEIFDPGTHRVQQDSHLAHPGAMRYFEDKNGVVWMGSWEHGLIRFDMQRRKIAQFFFTEDSIKNIFYDIVRMPRLAGDSLLGIGGNDGEGIFLFDPERGKIAGRVRHAADKPNSLGSNQVIRLYTDQAGLLWVGHYAGLSLFDPERQQVSATDIKRAPKPRAFTPFRAVITGFKILGQNQVFDRDSVVFAPFKLQHYQNAVTFLFTAADFENPKALRFEYRLEGSQVNWIEAGSNREATFLNLTGGHYTFRVRAVRADGSISGEASMKIQVIPPFWATWWFRALLALAFIALVYALFRYRELRRLEQEKLRLRIARDLHDEMGSTLSSISILSEAALRHLQADIDRARFGAIGERARQVMEAMSDIVWSVNPRNDKMANVLQRMKEFAVDVLESQGIALHFEASEAAAALNLPMEQRKDFYLLFKEAVNNAAKYSGARDVWVTVRADDGRLRLEVRDNGRGFDTAQVKRGNGLWNMERRAERMGGDFLVQSKDGEGTLVKVKM